MSQPEMFKILDAGASWPDCGYMDLALLDIGPEYVEVVLSTDLLEGDEEGLGPWKAIGFSMGNGAVVELVFHESSPTAGFVARSDLLHATEETLDSVLRVLRIDRSLVKWINPKIHVPGI